MALYYSDLRVRWVALTCVTAGELFTETDNIINEENGGYENVKEYIPIGQPNAGTLAKLQALEPSTTHGDRELQAF